MNQDVILMKQKLSLVKKNVYLLYDRVIKKNDSETREILTKYLIYLDHTYDDRIKQYVSQKNIEQISQNLGQFVSEYGIKVAKYEAISELLRNVYSVLMQFTEIECQKQKYTDLFRKYVSLISEPERIKNIPIKEIEEQPKQR